jgi:hypothetical protein
MVRLAPEAVPALKLAALVKLEWQRTRATRVEGREGCGCDWKTETCFCGMRAGRDAAAETADVLIEALGQHCVVMLAAVRDGRRSTRVLSGEAIAGVSLLAMGG